MKRIVLSLIVIGIIIAAIFAWIFIGSATTFSADRKYLFVYTGKTEEASVVSSLRQNDLI